VTDGPSAVERVHPPDALMRVLNPVMVRMLGSRFSRGPSRHLLVLHVMGRRSGRVFNIPVGHRASSRGGRVVITASQWRKNLRGVDAVDVTYQGVRRTVRSHLSEEPLIVAEVYRELIEDLGYRKAQRQLGLKVNVERAPTREELEDLVRREGLAAIHLDLAV
jgi:hypothetical protein